MIKAILFDFDGTLADSLGFYVKAYDVALKKFGLSLSEREIVDNCFDKTEEEVCKRLKINDVEGFRGAYFGAIERLFKDVKLFPGALETLNLAKKKGIKLGIITFASSYYINKMIDRFKLRKFFDVILSSSDVKNRKPHPEIALKACKKLNVSINLALVVGDSRGDMMVGKAAGCQTALFLPKEHRKIYNSKALKEIQPDSVFSDFNDLKVILGF